MDIAGGDVLEVDIVDPGAPLHVVGHPGRRHDVVHGEAGVRPQRRVAGGGAGELPSRRGPQALGVHLLDPLDHLEQPRPAGDAVGFQRGRHRQTDGFISTALVRHHQIGGQGVQLALDALHGSVKAAEVWQNKRALSYPAPPLPSSHSPNLLYTTESGLSICSIKIGGPPPPIRLRPGMVQWTCISGRSKLGRSKRGRNGVERGEVCPPPDRNGLEEQNTKDEKTVSCPVGRFTVLFCPQTREEKRL